MNMRQLRVRAGCNQTQWAELLGVCQSTVSRWEAGAVSPSLAYVKRVIKLLSEQGLTTDDVIKAFGDSI
jgi:DNA-binding XRE family transcriptional regulator